MIDTSHLTKQMERMEKVSSKLHKASAKMEECHMNKTMMDVSWDDILTLVWALDSLREDLKQELNREYDMHHEDIRENSEKSACNIV